MLGDCGLRCMDSGRMWGEQREDFVVAQAAPVEKGGRVPASSSRILLQSATQASQM